MLIRFNRWSLKRWMKIVEIPSFSLCQAKSPLQPMFLEGCLHRQECSSMACFAINYWSCAQNSRYFIYTSTQDHEEQRFFSPEIWKACHPLVRKYHEIKLHVMLVRTEEKKQAAETSDLQLDISDTCTDGVTWLCWDTTSCCLIRRSRFKRTDFTCRRNRVDVMKYT